VVAKVKTGAASEKFHRSSASRPAPQKASLAAGQNLPGYGNARPASLEWHAPPAREGTYRGNNPGRPREFQLTFVSANVSCVPDRAGDQSGLDAGFANVRQRRHIGGMAGALFVRVSADTSPNTNRTFEIWIVATDDHAEAEKAVREMVSPGRAVEVIYDLPSEETIKRLALPPGKAWLL